jgi:diguanylate cyclase (GGDEF)-like protein
MPEVFLIGRSSAKDAYKDVLITLGFTISRFDSLDKVMRSLREKPDLIVVDKSLSADPSFKEFLNLSRSIPKIVLSDTHAFRGFTPWTKGNLVCPVYAPEARELAFFAKRLLVESNVVAENDALKSELSILKRETDFFEDVSKTLTSSLELKKILTKIMEKVKDMTKAKAWSVLLVDNETGELVFEKTNAKKKKEMHKIRLNMGEGIAGWVASEGIPVVIPDVSKDERFFGKIDEAIDLKIKSLMCVPIKINNQVLGVLELVNKNTGEPFVKEDLALLMKLVDLTAIAIERTSLYQKMAELAITDDLTKLFNTRYLNRTIEIEIQRSSRYNTSISLIFMDIDYFKLINDRYGHIIGSKVLVEMGQLLLRSLRSVDIVARYGGDEFVIVLPQTPPASAAQIAERMRRSVEQNTFLKKEGYSLKLTASFGVASYPESAKSKEDLIRLADDAMYRVKHDTRNAVYAME